MDENMIMIKKDNGHNYFLWKLVPFYDASISYSIFSCLYSFGHLNSFFPPAVAVAEFGKEAGAEVS